MKNKSWLGGGKYPVLYESDTFWWIICFLERNYGSDSFPGIFHVIDIIFKIPVIVTFLLCFRRVEIIFVKLLWSLCSFSLITEFLLFINLPNILFLITIDFCKPEVIQGLPWNLSSHFLVFLRGVWFYIIFSTSSM